MKIVVDRFVSNKDATISKVSVDGRFVCFGLEDEYRSKKVSGETRIPAGTYKIKVRKEGGFHSRYGKRFPDIHQGMLHVQDVPNFKWILIHCGNTDEHTNGCLLVGFQAKAGSGEMKIFNSSSAYRKLYKMVIGAAKRDKLNITYEDSDR